MVRSLRSLRSLATCLAALILAATSASAAPILQVSGGILTGATGVDVNGTLYDVEFLDGTCAAVFNGCDEDSDTAFHSQADAITAATALFDQVFVDGPLGDFDSNPALTRGCSSSLGCAAQIPYAMSPGFVITQSARNLSAAVDIQLISSFPTNLDLTVFIGDTYARFTASTPTVPEPTSLSLLGLGLAGLAARRRRHSRAHVTRA